VRTTTGGTPGRESTSPARAPSPAFSAFIIDHHARARPQQEPLAMPEDDAKPREFHPKGEDAVAPSSTSRVATPPRRLGDDGSRRREPLVAASAALPILACVLLMVLGDEDAGSRLGFVVVFTTWAASLALMYRARETPLLPTLTQPLEGASTQGSQDVARDKALEENAQLKALVHGVPGFLVVADREMVIRYTNRDPSGLSLAGMNVLDLVSPEDSVTVEDAHRRVAQGSPSERYETVHRDVTSGEELVFESVVAARITDGAPDGFVGYSHDVTTAWRAAREVRLLAAALAHAADPIFLTDAGGRIRFVNQAFTRATGFAEADCRAWDALTLLSDRTAMAVVDNIRTAMETRQAFHGSVVYRRHGDGTFAAELSVGPVFDEQGHLIGFVSTIRDVTDRQRRAEEQAHAHKMASIGSLAAGIAHELNTPAQFVGDNLSFLERAFMKVQPFLSHVRVLTARVSSAHETTHDPVRAIAADNETLRLVDVLVRTAADAKIDYLMGEIPEAIAQSREGVDRIARVVSATMNFAKVSNKEKEPVDVGALVRDTVTVCKGMWGHVATLDANIARDLPTVMMQRDEIAQVLVHLITNAGHAIEDAVTAGLTRSGRIVVEANCENDVVAIRVTDDGVGIPVPIRHRIFEPYFTTRALGEGRGEGLPFAHRVIVAEHRGHIDVVSEEGEGTVVTVLLPREAKRAAVQGGNAG
jgi:PAS domain S-box-containing protein